MIALISYLWKEVGDIKDDALINGEMMEFLSRVGIEAADDNLSGAMDTGDENEKLDNTIKK